MTVARKTAYFGIFAALAIVFGYLERLIPASSSIPGVKLGLANIIVIITLYYFGGKEAFCISLTRILVTGLLFSGLSGMIYSLCGGMLSFITMYIGKKFCPFGIIGVSVLGGVFHNIGQILIAFIVVENLGLFYYIPSLIISGIFSGIIIGYTAGLALLHISKIKLNKIK